MLTGVVIAESLHSDARLDGKVINIARVTRVVVEGPADGQPPAWTLLEFEADLARQRRSPGNWPPLWTQPAPGTWISTPPTGRSSSSPERPPWQPRCIPAHTPREQMPRTGLQFRPAEPASQPMTTPEGARLVPTMRTPGCGMTQAAVSQPTT
jgi:hypothetical protein